MGVFSGSSNHTCPSEPTGPQYGSEHISGSMTFHDLTVVLCGAFTAITCLISGALLLVHATHFSNPREQTQILRIVFLVPVYAVLFFISGSFTNAAIYVEPWADAYEAIALASYLILLVTYLVPVPEMRDVYFDQLELQGSKGKPQRGGSLKWYRRIWFFAFQYTPVAILCAIFTDITQAAGKYCYQSNSPHFAKLWLTIIKSASVGIAVLRLITFYRRLKVPLKQHGVVRKLAAIKAIVGLTFLQSIIFTILNDTGAVDPSGKYSYNDIQFGMPAILICGEMVLFSLFNIYAYSPRPYFTSAGISSGESGQSVKGTAHYYGGPLGFRALLSALNPMEIISGMLLAVRYIISSPPVTNGYGNGSVGMEPLRQGYVERVDSPTGPPPYPYPPYQGAGEQLSGVERAHSPDPMYNDQYSRGPQTDQYTPLSRR